MKTEIPMNVLMPLTRIGRFEDYQTEALKTASMGKGHVVEGFVRVCGLVGESAELCAELHAGFNGKRETWGENKNKIEKELGDVLWYAATLAEWLKLGVHFSFDVLQGAADRAGVFECGYAEILCVRTGKLAELMKKHLGHDKPMDAFKGKELELMQDVFMAIAFVANTVGLDLGKVAAVNINKLRARYQGGGFTAQLANAHVDERTILDQDETRPADSFSHVVDPSDAGTPTVAFIALPATITITTEPQCTGTIVHSEYVACPKHD